MSTHTTDSDSDLVAHNLSASHGQSFTLSWVDLSWHDTWSWFVFWKIQFSQSTSWTTSQESDIVGNLEKTDSDSVQSSMEFDHWIFGSQWFELVWSSDEGMTSFQRYSIGNTLSETDVSVETCSDSCSSLSKFGKLGNFTFDSSDSHFHLVSVSWEFLSQSNWGGILGVSSTDLDDIGEFLRLKLK